MNKNLAFLLIISFLLTLSLSGCVDPNPSNGGNGDLSIYAEKFVGTWNTTEPIPWYIKPEFTFFSNGSFDVQGFGGNFTANENKLILTWDDQGKIFTYQYDFIDDNTLKLTFTDTGAQGIYKRK